MGLKRPPNAAVICPPRELPLRTRNGWSASSRPLCSLQPLPSGWASILTQWVRGDGCGQGKGRISPTPKELCSAGLWVAGPPVTSREHECPREMSSAAGAGEGGAAISFLFPRSPFPALPTKPCLSILLQGQAGALGQGRCSGQGRPAGAGGKVPFSRRLSYPERPLCRCWDLRRQHQV